MQFLVIIVYHFTSVFLWFLSMNPRRPISCFAHLIFLKVYRSLISTEVLAEAVQSLLPFGFRFIFI